MTKKVFLEEKVLDSVWQEWLSTQPLTSYQRCRVDHSYRWHSLWGGAGFKNKQDKFADWLFSQGCSIRRRDKQLRLEFTDDAKAAHFILRYG